MNELSHVDGYPEIPVSLASTRTALKTGSWRSVRPVLTERLAPCSAACPAGVAVAAYLASISAGRLDEAFVTFTEHNPFPRITGRVCPHFCEDRCNVAARTGEAAVSIRSIERWLGDATADLPHQQPEHLTGERIAVVGAGPAGLSAAYYLRRSGHAVVVYDRHSAAGGMLRYGIPDYRLPEAIVDDEVARLAAMGIDFRQGVALGEDVTLDELEATHAAVFVATGAWTGRPAGVVGERLLEPGLAFLEAAGRGGASPPGRRCAVVGGGNTAMDVARVLRRLGAEVTVLYRRTAEEMPAIREEYERAAADGVRFEWLTAPRSVEKDAGELAVTVETMRLGVTDDSGRRRPEPTGLTRLLRFDAVFSATGETADLAPFPAELHDAAGRLAVDADGATADPRLFVGGDLATGAATVVAAIVAGRRAARAIDHRLGYADRWPAEWFSEEVAAAEANPAYVAGRPRAAERPAGGKPFDEETLTITEAEALAEIGRCYSCGHCNACGTCFVFCPDGAIVWDDGPQVDLEFCKGCGICVTECPGHAFILVNERELSHA